MTRLTARLALCVVLLLVPGCGDYVGCCSGGGGGGGGDSGSDGLPGSLMALAIEGQAVPFPDSGLFGPIPDDPLMDVAVGGWAGFVLPIVRGDIGQSPTVLFVGQPDGQIVRTYGVGETVEGTGNAVIGSFERIWMCPTGRVLAYVTLIGVNTFALISAVVANGAIVETFTILIDQEEPPGVTGGIASIDYETLQVVTVGPDPGLCALFFRLTSIPGNTFLYTVRLNGANPLPLLVTGEFVPIDARPILSIDAFNVSDDGATLAVVTTLDDPSVDPQILMVTPTLSLSYAVIARPGDPLPAGVITDVYAGGPILISPTADVVWQAMGSSGLPDDLILRVSVPALLIGGTYEVLVRTGDLAPGTAGTFETLSILNQRVSAVNEAWPAFVSTISGDPVVMDAIYAYAMPDFVEIVKNGDTFTPGVTFDGLFGLGGMTYRDATRDSSSTAFRDALTGGAAPTGLFWSWASGDPPLGVALQGDTLIGTPETFGSFTDTVHTVAEDTLLFMANLSPSGRGILRQGP